MQGAGLELTQIPVSNKEKNYLDEQHTHLLQCLEKATVCAYVILKIIYTLPDTIARQDSQHIFFYKSLQFFLKFVKDLLQSYKCQLWAMLAAENSPLQWYVRPLVECLTKGSVPSSYTSFVGRVSNFANLGKINFVT